MYSIGEISNRDIALLYSYRILKQPHDFLTAVLTQQSPIVAEIMISHSSEFKTDDGRAVVGYGIGVDIASDKIPYLEFLPRNDIDRKALETLLYLDGDVIYGVGGDFTEPVTLRIYQVDSIEDIRLAIQNYLQLFQNIDIDSLRKRFEEQSNKPSGLPAIAGKSDNLIQFKKTEDRLDVEDSGYKLSSALDAQMLVNPSQELLMSLPRKLKHSINISITDSQTRYLDSFSGYSINIRGNGNWVLRDLKSSVDFTTGSGEVYLWNCSLVHFRTSTESIRTNLHFECSRLRAHKTVVVVNQGIISEVTLTGGSTLICVPTTAVYNVSSLAIQSIAYIGLGCSLYSWIGRIPVSLSKVIGMLWSTDILTKETLLYIAGRRIDEVSSEHDFEIHPSHVVETTIGTIHITEGEG